MPKERFYKVIRVITVAPIVAAITLTVIFVFCPQTFPSGWYYAYSIFFLGILPLLAYPLQRFIPVYKEKGREGQRVLAMIFAVSGYVLGILTAALTRAPKSLLILYLEYLLSGLVLLIFNKFLLIKLSGHACGIVGPIFLLVFFKLYIGALLGCAIALLVFSASIRTKRHTAMQLLGGSIVPVCVLLFLSLF